MNINIRADNTVEIDGYVNAVERLSKTLTDRNGKFVERICKGAFRKALERAEDVRILLNHNWDKDLGGTADGNLELEEDPIGLHARTIISDEEVVKKARNGELVGWSFGFSDREVENGEEKGLTLRDVKDLDLYEISLIDRSKIPAYDGTLVSVRTADESKSINVSDVTEASTRITEEKPKEEQKTSEIDYTKYKKMISEMKGA